MNQKSRPEKITHIKNLITLVDEQKNELIHLKKNVQHLYHSLEEKSHNKKLQEVEEELEHFDDF